MSRSYRKNPIITDGSPKRVKEQKRIANKAVRRTWDIPSGRAYKKVYPTWDIHDNCFHETFEEWMKDKNDDYFEYWNGGGWIYLGNYLKGEKLRAFLEEESKKYANPPNIKEEFIKWRRKYCLK